MDQLGNNNLMNKSKLCLFVDNKIKILKIPIILIYTG